MQTFRTSLIPLICLSVLAPAVVFADDFEHGREALQAGNVEQAIAIWQPLAEAGDRDAQHAIGMVFEYGHGTAPNDRAAIAWYQKAAEQDLPAAQYRLGVLHDNGWGTPRNAARAVYWYSRAAELGHAFAQHDLAFMYFNGTGVAPDRVQAYKWLRIASMTRPDLMIKHLSYVATGMPAAEIEKAEKQAAAWLEAQKI